MRPRFAAGDGTKFLKQKTGTDMWKINLSFLLSALLLASGCVREDRSACPPPTPAEPDFKFVYSPNNDGKNEFPERIKDMQLYVFDSNGVLVDIIRVSKEDLANGTLNTNLPDGKYTFVAVAGSGPDLTQGGFHGGQSSGTNPSGYPPATIGTTTLGDFRVMLDTNPSATPGGNATPKVPQFDDLYWGTATDVTIQNGKPAGTVNMNLTKVTSRLEIDLSGLENLPAGTTPHIFVTGRNDIILGNGTLDPNAPVVRYDPYSQTTQGNTLTALIKTMRLDLSRSSDMPVMLYVQDPVTGQNLIDPINVVDTIRNMKDANGNPAYPDQASIDRQDLFRIGLALQPRQNSDSNVLNVKVTVNGFQPTPLGPLPEVAP
jgi:hypothetical protein